MGIPRAGCGRCRRTGGGGALTPAARAAAEDALAAAGARVVGVDHPRQSLEDLFRRLVTGSRD